MTPTDELSELLRPLDGETARAFQGFMAYVSLGRQRSIDKAYRAVYRGQGGDTQGARAPTFFSDWASRYNWRERVEAYEAALEAEYLALMRDEHYAELAQYQRDLLKQGKQLGDLAAAMSVYSARELKRLIETGVPMNSDELSRFIRAAAAVSNAATEARANSLLVKHLSAELEEIRKAEEATASA